MPGTVILHLLGTMPQAAEHDLLQQQAAEADAASEGRLPSDHPCKRTCWLTTPEGSAVWHFRCMHAAEALYQ